MHGPHSIFDAFALMDRRADRRRDAGELHLSKSANLGCKLQPVGDAYANAVHARGQPTGSDGSSDDLRRREEDGCALRRNSG